MHDQNEDEAQTREENIVRTYEYDDSTVLAVDLGDGSETTVDVVDGMAIIVQGDKQVEIDLPDGATVLGANNGVVTIELA